MDTEPIRTFEAEGRTYTEARRRLSQVTEREAPLRFSLVAERIVAGEEHTVKGEAETTQAAREQARQRDQPPRALAP